MGYIGPGTFAALPVLQLLDLSYNRLETLRSDMFTGLVSLTGLILTNNRLRSVDSGMFVGLTSLQRLMLDSNEISSLGDTPFPLAFLDSLTQLNLTFNKIPSLHTLLPLACPCLLSIDRQCMKIAFGSFQVCHNPCGAFCDDYYACAMTLSYLYQRNYSHTDCLNMLSIFSFF